MDTTRRWVVSAALGALALLAGGWLLLISPTRAEAEALREQAASQEATNVQLSTRLEVLEVKAAELPRREQEIAEVAEKIPGEAALPDLLRALTAAATSSGVELVSVVPGLASPVVTEAAPPAAPAPADPAAATAPAAPAPPAPAAAGGLSRLPITLDVVGDFYAVQQFVASLEELPRALRVTDLALAPGNSPTVLQDKAAPVDGRSLKTTITGSVFVGAPASPAAAGGPAPGAAPAAGPPTAVTS